MTAVPPSGPPDPAATTRPGRLGVGVVGAGRVGAVLGSALRSVGHAVVGASGVSDDSRERIETLLPGVANLEIPDVVERAELVLMAVPDDALAGLVAGLAEVGAWQGGQIVVHTSGRYGTDVLAPAQRAGAIPLAVHPAMTFTGTSLDLARLTGCTFAVTGPGAVLPIGQALVVEIGGEPVVVDEAARGLYHAALAHGSNHLVVLVAQAAQALEAAGIEHPGRVLAPLLGAALDGATRSADVRDGVGPGAISALTGPVSRGDAGTVATHLEVLGDLAARTGATDVPATYTELARGATRRALASHRIDDVAARALLDALDEPRKEHE
ncbi:putative short-subunit dehydrogenase-like oxidoreductase (DUF2520 family) [Isoptericola sp. CG 20/1183]|uniref:Short-subunit dehydrogenase-like oxidoreductase (DUF2520 family) n=1 Tax=Isoptericola halotolerans TaxID=300560 RepID=A0ABX5EIA7_9MICO|nr:MULTISPECIES: DUF2520 domain-containing protein [Isoptericola]PRZ08185.1 putative short-subunit dehydrogenase-like oxidoreductase (DUF2520 family) [Isoptericola halotolerans]PRZ08982.1 putative short-subunit dehydrogenase-like oxidoreductase (DUF2520 family) [Isoptericola sp. CG 20/1183]